MPDITKPCSVKECGAIKHYAKGLCRQHYVRARYGRPLDVPIGDLRLRQACSVQGCDGKHYGKGYCHLHYKRMYKGQKVEGPRLRNRPDRIWGPWYFNSDGYVVRSQSVDGKMRYQYQHRLVMEETVGRPLLKHENVHHLNGVRDDNRPDNLELWSKSQPYGQRVVDKLAWAREIIELYGDENA